MDHTHRPVPMNETAVLPVLKRPVGAESEPTPLMTVSPTLDQRPPGRLHMRLPRSLSSSPIVKTIRKSRTGTFDGPDSGQPTPLTIDSFDILKQVLAIKTPSCPHTSL